MLKYEFNWPSACARRPVTAVLAGLLLAWAAPAFAQATHAAHPIPSVPDALLSRAVPLRPGIGRAHDPVSTTVPQAQAFYDQGLAYLHSFVWIEAARSFNQALRLDPALAVAHAALSVAYTELNAPAQAQAALDRARALAVRSASAHDRAHIEARARQMVAEAAPGDPTTLAAYRAALDAAIASFPGDVELLLLRGVADSPDPSDRGQGSGATSIRYYEQALAVSPGHFAAAHYLTHAYENAGRVKDALSTGAAFAAAAPLVPHALHMHGHVLRRAGRIGEAVAAFESADRLETAYFEAEAIAPEYHWHHEHNLDLLASSYQYLGQLKKAEALMKKAFDLPSALAVQMFNKRAWPAFLTSRGRIDDALAAARVLIANPSPLVRATGHVQAGHAHLARRRYQEAAASTNAALKELRTSPTAGAVAGLAFEALQGEFFLRTGERAKGEGILRDVVRKTRALPGPDNWVQALFGLEAVARAAREADDWAFADWAARQMLEHDPNYAGSHYALALVAQHNGDTKTAQIEFARAGKLWAGADGGLAEMERLRKQ